MLHVESFPPPVGSERPYSVSVLGRQRPIDRSTADLERLRDSGRSRAVSFHLFDLGWIDAGLAPLVDAALLRVGDPL